MGKIHAVCRDDQDCFSIEVPMCREVQNTRSGMGISAKWQCKYHLGPGKIWFLNEDYTFLSSADHAISSAVLSVRSHPVYFSLLPALPFLLWNFSSTITALWYAILFWNRSFNSGQVAVIRKEEEGRDQKKSSAVGAFLLLFCLTREVFTGDWNSSLGAGNL